MTNMVITPNQTRSKCAEDPKFSDNHCSTDDDCEALEPVTNGNGKNPMILQAIKTVFGYQVYHYYRVL